MLEHTDIRKKVEVTLLSLLILTALVYGVLKTAPLLIGPTITVYNPQDSDSVSSSTFEISGKVSHAKEISIQGRPIPVGTDGHFIETLVANPPYTLIVLHAKDVYGKSVTKTLRVTPEK